METVFGVIVFLKFSTIPFLLEQSLSLLIELVHTGFEIVQKETKEEDTANKAAGSNQLALDSVLTVLNYV